MNAAGLPETCTSWLERWVAPELVLATKQSAAASPGDAQLMGWVFLVIDWLARDFPAIVFERVDAPPQATRFRELAPLLDRSSASAVLPLLDSSMTVARVSGAQPLFLSSIRLAVEMTIHMADRLDATGSIDESSLSTIFGDNATMDMALRRGFASGAPRASALRQLSARVVQWPK